MTTKTIKAGDTFQAPYADANATWKVIRKQGRDMWRCELIEPEEYRGPVQGFLTSVIEQAMETRRNFTALMDRHDRFYAALPLGSIVHYSNGFAAFVRCERVEGPKGQRLKPVALVGNWPDHELHPLSYWVRNVVLGTDRFEPNVSTIWEAQDERGQAWDMRVLAAEGRVVRGPKTAPFDPTTEAPIVLPTLNEEHR